MGCTKTAVLTAQHGYGTSAGGDTSAVQNLLHDKIQAKIQDPNEPRLDKGERKMSAGNDEENKTGCRKWVGGQRRTHILIRAFLLSGPLISLNSLVLTLMSFTTWFSTKNFFAVENLCLYKHLKNF